MEKRRENFYDQQINYLNYTWLIGFLSMFYLDGSLNST